MNGNAFLVTFYDSLGDLRTYEHPWSIGGANYPLFGSTIGYLDPASVHIL
jgi:hypothetical protein